MFEYTCYDESSNIIDCLYQWDSDRTIGIDLGSQIINDSIEVRFSNKFIENSKSITATTENGIIYVHIPDEFLTYNCILYMHICIETSSTKKTIAYVSIPVRKMKKPLNYDIGELEKESWIATRQETKLYLGI